MLVTDSKSSLESLYTTWVRRIGHLEQDASRLIYDIAERGAHGTLAFVFSHVGGAPGNDYVDKRAQKACNKYGARWPAAPNTQLRVEPVWHVDSTRRAHRDRHRTVDRQVTADGYFRFKHAPSDSCGGTRRCPPSARLPREMARADEVLVYRARVGMMTQLGGCTRDGEREDCPACGKEGVLGGDETLAHVLRCPELKQVMPPLTTSDLWSNPIQAAAALRRVVATVATVPCATRAGRQAAQHARG